MVRLSTWSSRRVTNIMTTLGNPRNTAIVSVFYETFENKIQQIKKNIKLLHGSQQEKIIPERFPVTKLSSPVETGGIETWLTTDWKGLGLFWNVFWIAIACASSSNKLSSYASIAYCSSSAFCKASYKALVVALALSRVSITWRQQAAENNKSYSLRVWTHNIYLL